MVKRFLHNNVNYKYRYIHNLQFNRGAVNKQTTHLTDELALVKCLNQKEAVEYEAQLEKLVTKAIKHFQQGQDR